MSGKRIIPRERANRDANEAVDYYLDKPGEKAALGFINELERAYHHIARHPASGSPAMRMIWTCPASDPGR